MAGNVVLGYDGSDGSKAALRVAVGVARAFAAPLSVVFGYEPSPVGGESADHRHALEALGDKLVGEATALVASLDPDVDVEPLVVPIRPVDSLLEAAKERDALVIVVGASGERPLVGVILGAVPHKLLYRSEVPVLVVPATGD
ncbi:MAG TPA: universal stress protein [Acidimicrobiales bacterium]|nr:universal stress protein [Acidimicrobiales bacterium]